MRVRQQRGADYAWVVVGVTFVALLVAAGLRSAPGVLIRPIELHFGWSRATVSTAAAVGILLYGLVGPFAVALMQSVGVRRTMLWGLALMAASTLASLWMTQPWHYVLTWGVLSGIGSGAIAPVLGATIASRWFAERQGLVMGMLSAASATGALVFLPAMAWLSQDGAWRPVVTIVAGAALLLIPLVWRLMPESPAHIGLARYGERGEGAVDAPSPRGSASPMVAIHAFFRGARHPMFWLLFGTFFICGLTTNGLIGTHFIAFCGDRGIAPVAAAGLLSMMGFFDLIGTTLSGWLTDRYDPKKLLVIYYAFRGLSLIALPFIQFDALSLTIFAIFYGLDWIATVPPTVKLSNQAFGRADGPILFGWILVGHQMGAALAAYGAGVTRQYYGDYLPAFVVAGAFGVLAGAAMLISARKVQVTAAA